MGGVKFPEVDGRVGVNAGASCGFGLDDRADAVGGEKVISASRPAGGGDCPAPPPFPP